MRYGVLPLVLGIGLLQGAARCEEKPMLPQGHVFFETGFESPDALKGWSGPAKLGAGCESAQSLCVERAGDASGTTTLAQMPLPVEKMRGYQVYFSAMIRAENVTEKPKPYHGIKFMTSSVVGGDTSYEDASIGVGTFDWKPVAFRVSVPDDATALSLLAGLQGVAGKVWFDNIKVIVRKPPPVAKPRAVTGPIYKGHDLPRLRGVQPMIGDATEERLRLLGKEWNANVIRWGLIRWKRQVQGDLLDLAAYDQWLDAELKKLDAALPLCEKYGLYVVIDLHSPPGGNMAPGGYIGTRGGLFSNAACQKKFIAVWEQMARRYKNARAVWGYDLANEPIPPRNVEPGLLFEGVRLQPGSPPLKAEEGLDDWDELAERAAKAIRAIDPDRAIIVEPALGFSPKGLKSFRPLDVPNVVYSVHMYDPGSFTHQGVHEQRTKDPWVKKYRYPGEIEGKRWDKAQLEAALKPAIDFQKNYGVHLYIGEFSAVRWAPDNSAHRYLQDLIEIFEAHEWDWTYFCFGGGWNGMSVEHGEDKENNARSEQPTDRQNLLREWFAKNRKPGWYRAQ